MIKTLFSSNIISESGEFLKNTKSALMFNTICELETHWDVETEVVGFWQVCLDFDKSSNTEKEKEKQTDFASVPKPAIS